METHLVKILSVQEITHDVRQFTVEKPAGYSFVPGQATEVSLPDDAWKEERRPFTFTGLNEWDHLQFTIKIYKERHGVTDQLGMKKPGDTIVVHDVWGAIQYKGEGTFIAGGAGITPFIAIFRQLQKDGAIGGNQLVFANKTEKDIIMRKEWDEWLGSRVHHILSREEAPNLLFGKVDQAWLKQNITDFHQHFYVCGPDAMVAEVKAALESLGGAGTLVTVEL